MLLILKFVILDNQDNVCLDSEAANAPGHHAFPSFAIHDVKDHLKG